MLCFDAVCKTYAGPNGEVPVLRDLSFQMEPGDLAIVQGPSGCGKSTLLFTAGAMMPPEKGTVHLAGKDLYGRHRAQRHRIRGASVGFIFQRFHLIPYLDVRRNILWPLRWSAHPESAAGRFAELVRRLELGHRLEHRPAQLSAGEQQRVAVARALIGNKILICADEPTGNLDEDNAAIMMDILKAEASRGAMVLLVTHQRKLIDAGTLRIQWKNGLPEIGTKING